MQVFMVSKFSNIMILLRCLRAQRRNRNFTIEHQKRQNTLSKPIILKRPTSCPDFSEAKIQIHLIKTQFIRSISF